MAVFPRRQRGFDHVLHTFVRPAVLGVRFNMLLANVTSPQANGLPQLPHARRR
jgi:hypothetical protein